MLRTWLAGPDIETMDNVDGARTLEAALIGPRATEPPLVTVALTTKPLSITGTPVAGVVVPVSVSRAMFALVTSPARIA